MDILLLVVALIVVANALVGLALVVRYRAERREQSERSKSSMFYAGPTW